MNLVTFILSSLPLLIEQYAKYLEDEDLKTTLHQLERDLSLPRIQTYDYIVVGGGSAGSVVASRLSERFNVLLLERGGYPVPAVEVQYFSHKLIDTGPEINNIFHSVKQEHFSLETGGIFTFTNGRMLGGSGSHNDNTYSRGSPHDFDNYANLTGDHSWRYENVLPYFKKMENYVGELIHENERGVYYGTGGPINVITAVQPPRLLQHWLVAGQELGFTVSDPNAHQSESFAPVASSLRGGVKSSSYKSYIKPFENGVRSTLTVLKYSDVEQVLIDERKVAYGVIYRRHGIPQIAHASQEIILSGGAISSPLLLIKSGIGPKHVLQEAQIPVIMDIPGVGQNLRDHAGIYLNFNVNNISKLIFLPELSEENLDIELHKFHSVPSDRTGLFTTPFGMGQAFITSSISKQETGGNINWPDIQFFFTSRGWIPNPLDRTIEGQDFQIAVLLNRQNSVGEIGFNSTAYLLGHRKDTELAEINHRFYSDPRDIIALIEGIQLAFKIVGTPAFRALGVEYVEKSPRACAGFSLNSDNYWKCFIQQRSLYYNHAVGTVQMGSPSDPKAVLDSKLRVRGVKGLRVADASIFPRAPNANINAPTIMIGEKAAHEIMYGG